MALHRIWVPMSPPTQVLLTNGESLCRADLNRFAIRHKVKAYKRWIRLPAATLNSRWHRHCRNLPDKHARCDDFRYTKIPAGELSWSSHRVDTDAQYLLLPVLGHWKRQSASLGRSQPGQTGNGTLGDALARYLLHSRADNGRWDGIQYVMHGQR